MEQDGENPLPDSEYALFADDDSAKSYVNEILVRTWTEEGISRWWLRPRHQLGEQTPSQVWAEDPQAVIDLASGGLDQTVS